MTLCLIMCTAAANNPVKIQMLPTGQDQTFSTVLFSDDATPTFTRSAKATLQRGLEGNIVTVTCLRNCDENYHQRDWTYVFMDNNGNRWSSDGWDAEEATPGETQLQIPAGTYDVLVQYFANQSESHYCYVIHEQVELNNDTTLALSSEEANIQIQFKPCLPNGDICYPETVLIHDDYSQEVIQEGNIGDLCFSQSISVNGATLYSTSSNWANIWTGARERDLTHMSDIFINQVSNRFAFCTTMAFCKYDLDGSYYVVDFEVSTCKDTIVSNRPGDYVLYEKMFKQTPYGQQRGLYPGVGFRQADEYNLLGGFRLMANQSPGNTNYTLADDEPCRYYLCNAHEDDSSPISYFISPQVGDGEYPWFPMSTLTRDPFVTLENGSVVHIFKGLISLEDNTYCVQPDHDAESGYSFYPTSSRNPVHTFDVEKMKTISGNSCPIMVQSMLSDVLPSGDTQKSLYFNGYLGRNGETRESDWFVIHSTIKVDGDTVADADMLSAFNWTKNVDQGLVDVTVTNENVDVDGLPGKNVTNIHFDMAGNDDIAPTLQMLDFRDMEDNAIDRFSTVDEGKLQFYCGDFNVDYIDNAEHTQYFICNDLANVEVAYSPYQADTWAPLDATEVSEYFFDGMGHYYAASLASVTGEAYEGWFDLKIRLEDAAGNWQEQVISPAFRIDNLAYSSVATVGSNNAHEVARYNLAGQRVDSNATGVVIIKMSDGTARKVLVK